MDREELRKKLGIFQYAEDVDTPSVTKHANKPDKHVGKWLINVKNCKALAWNSGRHQLSSETISYLNDYVKRKVVELCNANGNGKRI